MRTKNAPRITPDESDHLRLVKLTRCVLCDAPPPVEAHHIEQGMHRLTVGVCTECHRGSKGIHGDGTMLRLRFKVAGLRGEMFALNETLARVDALRGLG